MWKVTRRYVLATSAVRLRDSSRFPLFDLTETTLLIRWQEDVRRGVVYLIHVLVMGLFG